ncbi:alkaline phosphatase family protein [Alkaliphilus transvaalensis]|uniref:hypothetical protein n=1 Tax=Alkaliphilus transvaalensis TaxID=114628 RepID=UPI00047EE42A|nr:hypothetical protein [Alkaliphilus transvaalensis]
MKIARLILTILLIIVTILSSPLVAFGQHSQDNQNKVVMIIVNRVDLDDLSKMKEVQKMMEEGSIGLMNIRASGRYSEYKSYATIGWGTRAEASQDGQAFSNINEETIAIYQRRTGETPEEKGIINLAINTLIQQNLRGEFGAIPGSLGEVLRRNGIKTGMIGSASSDENKSPSAGLIAMDQKGYIDYGDVEGRHLIDNPLKPYGIQTNYELLFEDFKEFYLHSDFIVIETGDLSRLESYKSKLNDETYEKYRNAIFEDIQIFVEKVMDYIDQDQANTLLMLVVPYPTDVTFEAGNRLTPVVFYGKNIKTGLLVSDTTRRTGIIGNIDIAPTILAHFGLNSNEMMTGREISSVTSDNNLNYLRELGLRVLYTSQQRYRVLYTFAVFEMLASVVALLAIILKKNIPQKIKGVIAGILLATIIIPFVFLILPLLKITAITYIYIFLIILTIIFVSLIRILAKQDEVGTLILATGLVVLGLVIDILTGQNLIKNSLLGYDPIIGARYYGIGNEFTGVLIGSTLVFSTAIIQKNAKFKWGIPFIYILIIMIIGFPKWGANVGGTITAMVAFLYSLFRVFGKQMNIKKWLLIAGLVVLGVGTFALIDLFVLESKSHLAGAIHQIYRGGPWVILQIITRKLAMNIRVMGVTIWSRVLLMAVAVLGILFYKPMGVLKKIANEYSQLTIGWTGILVAAAVGFVVNDSGVVMAAMATIFLTTSILYLVINGK